MELVTENTSHREQNHHQFKKADDAPKKNIILTELLPKENKQKMQYILAQRLKVLVKYNTYAAAVLPSDRAV